MNNNKPHVMTPQQVYVLTSLLKGMYIVKTINFENTDIWKLYEGNQNPVTYFYLNTIKAIRHFMKNDGIKLVINLEEVAKLHGKTLVKIEYMKLYPKVVKVKKVKEIKVKPKRKKKEPAKVSE